MAGDLDLRRTSWKPRTRPRGPQAERRQCTVAGAIVAGEGALQLHVQALRAERVEQLAARHLARLQQPPWPIAERPAQPVRQTSPSAWSSTACRSTDGSPSTRRRARRACGHARA